MPNLIILLSTLFFSGRASIAALLNSPIDRGRRCTGIRRRDHRTRKRRSIKVKNETGRRAINFTVGRNSRSLESRACVLSELGIRQDPAGFKKRVRYSSRQFPPKFKCVHAPPLLIRELIRDFRYASCLRTAGTVSRRKLFETESRAKRNAKTEWAVVSRIESRWRLSLNYELYLFSLRRCHAWKLCRWNNDLFQRRYVLHSKSTCENEKNSVCETHFRGQITELCAKLTNI